MKKLQSDSSSPFQESETTDHDVASPMNLTQHPRPVKNSSSPPKPYNDPKYRKTSPKRKIKNKRKKSTPARCKESKLAVHNLTCVGMAGAADLILPNEKGESKPSHVDSSFSTNQNITGKIINITKVEPVSPRSDNGKINDDVDNAVDTNNYTAENVVEELNVGTLNGDKRNVAGDEVDKSGNISLINESFGSSYPNNSSPHSSVIEKEAITRRDDVTGTFGANLTVLNDVTGDSGMKTSPMPNGGRDDTTKGGENIFEKMGFNMNSKGTKEKPGDDLTRTIARTVEKNHCETESTAERNENTECKPNSRSIDKLALDDFSTEELLGLLEADGGIFKCDCSLIFTDEIIYYLHRNVHGSGGKFRCGFCDHEASDQYFFMIHQIQEHRCSGNP